MAVVLPTNQNHICYKCQKEIEKDTIYYEFHPDCSKPKWIGVDDQLPEYDTEFITYCDAKGVYVNYFWAGTWKDMCGEVTHWMPLPEPPEGE